MDGKYGTIELLLLPGNTPTLCGRPIIKALGMTMHFAQKRLRVGSSPWIPAKTRRVPLVPHECSIHYDPERPEFVLRTHDQGMEQDEGHKLNDFMMAEHGLTSCHFAGMTSLSSTCPPMSPRSYIDLSVLVYSGKYTVGKLERHRWLKLWAWKSDAPPMKPAGTSSS